MAVTKQSTEQFHFFIAIHLDTVKRNLQIISLADSMTECEQMVAKYRPLAEFGDIRIFDLAKDWQEYGSEMFEWFQELRIPRDEASDTIKRMADFLLQEMRKHRSE